MNETKDRIQTGVTFRTVSWMRNRRAILRNADFEAPVGRITVLFGPSGAGKTTSLRLIAGFETPGDGEIRIDNQVVSSPQTCLSPRHRRVGLCFQEDALWPALSVRDHVKVTLCSRYRDKAWIDLQTQELLNRFGLIHLAQRKPAHLSGGEKKRLALARALAVNPSVLLLDEPLSSLDGPARCELIAYLKTCRNENRAVILVTHQLEEAFALGDRLVILVEGNVLQQGPLLDVLRHPVNSQAAQLLGYKNFFPVSLVNGCAESPFGHWDVSSELQGEKMAASFAEDFCAEPDPCGIAVVELCWPETRQFRLLARYNDETYEAFAEREFVPGDRVSLRVRHTPAIF